MLRRSRGEGVHQSEEGSQWLKEGEEEREGVSRSARSSLGLVGRDGPFRAASPSFWFVGFKTEGLTIPFSFCVEL